MFVLLVVLWNYFLMHVNTDCSQVAAVTELTMAVEMRLLLSLLDY
jgi:hypothetical protein